MRPITPRLRSTTLRIAGLYLALFAGSTAALLGFVYYATAGYLARQTDAAIAAEAAELASRFHQGGLIALAREISQKAAANIGRRSVYMLVDGDLDPIAGNMNRWPRKIAPSRSGWIEFRLGGAPGGPDPIRARLFRLGPEGKYHLLIGRNISAQRSFQRVMWSALTWGVLISLGLGLLGGVLMSRTIAGRLERINRTSRAVMAGNLQQRVPTRGAGDEFDRLAENLNGMLDQIEYLMASVRQVSDNIAHDLRTPLTRLRWRLERLAAGEDASGDLLAESIADADGLLTTFQALLRIAEVESGSRGRFTAVDAASLTADVAELYEPVAAAHEQTLDIATEPVHLAGDRDLLFQALTNLADNAIKYTPPGGTITLAARTVGAGVELVVADSGPGIAGHLRGDVLKRFVRLEAHRTSGGSGLGLSLVAAVVRLHDGALHLEDNAPGLRVRLAIPLARGAAA